MFTPPLPLHPSSTFPAQSGWGDLLAGKYEEVLDESTGEMIMMEKGTKRYKLDAQGNIINPPPAEVAAPAPGPSPFGAVFGGGAPAAGGGGFVFGSAPAGGGGGGSGGGFVFGNSSSGGGDSGGGFKFGGGGGESGGGGGFVFGANGPSTPQGAEKRQGENMNRTAVKRRRTRDMRLSGNESGVVFVVGNGDCGQLGLGSEDDDCRDSLIPIRIASLDALRVCQLVCGGLHTGALTVDGHIWTWGCNDDEVLGRPEEESEPHRVRGALEHAKVTKITAGDSHMVALAQSGEVYSWGTYKDSNGYIGYSAATMKAATPTLVPNLPKCSSIASGADHTLAVARDGFDVFAWGCGEKGQLGRDLEWEKETKKRYLQPTEAIQLRLSDKSGIDVQTRLKLALNENLLTVVRLSGPLLGPCIAPCIAPMLC